MRRLLLALCLTCPVFGLGCSMCDNPYDYCGPVVESGHGHYGGHYGGYHGDYDGQYGEHEVHAAPVEKGEPRESGPRKTEPTKAAPYYEEDATTMAPPRDTVSVAKRRAVSANAEPGRLQSAPRRRVR